MRRIAFHAPMKPPDHPIASGDREIARLTMTALEQAGFGVELVSHQISYQKRPSPVLFDERRRAGIAEAERILAMMRNRPGEERPVLWLTYHPYCKAPDWLGPFVARELGIPYATLEACRTRQDTDADWADGRANVQAAIRQATVNFCLKPSDRAYLETILPSMETVCDIAPFIDLDAMPPRRVRTAANPVPVIVAAGMMRPGKKQRCFLMLAEALHRVAGRPWRLVLIGDGPARPTIEAAFAAFDPRRIEWTGAIAHDAVLDRFDHADILAWPGHREPIGMVYLEAAARGLPVVAFASLGVPQVVHDGETGLLVEDGDTTAYGAAVARLLDVPELRARMGRAGFANVARRHGMAAASETFGRAIGRVLDGGLAPAGSP